VRRDRVVSHVTPSTADNRPSRSEALEALRRHVAASGQLPSVKHPVDGLPTAWTVRRMFGSWNQYVAAAGFTPRAHPVWSEPDVIDAIKTWADEHDRQPPSRADWKRAHASHPSYTTARRLFGTWTNAIRAAGLSPQRAKPVRWTDAAILDALWQWAQAHGPPRALDWNSVAPDHPTRALVTRRFGSWDAALLKAGLRSQPPEHQWSRDRIIHALADWATAHQRPPRAYDWKRAGPDHPGRFHVWKRFGSWQAALAAAGLSPLDIPHRADDARQARAETLVLPDLSDPCLRLESRFCSRTFLGAGALPGG